MVAAMCVLGSFSGCSRKSPSAPAPEPVLAASARVPPSAAPAPEPPSPPITELIADAAAPDSSMAAEVSPASGTAAGDMLLVPAGPFVMGADRGGQEDEHPAHTVDLAAFWLDRTEVTNEAYGRCVGAGVCRPHDDKSARLNRFGEDAPFRGPRQPISSVGWDDARAYCQWLGKRLPREAEWEKAARGTDGRQYPWGNEPPTAARAVFSTGHTAEVGAHPAGAGPFGHLDLGGNVWEWTADIYDPYAYRRPHADRGEPGSCEEVLAAQNELRKEGKQGFTGSNPIPTECERVLRGGAFNYDGPGLRSSNRVHHPARFRLVMAGFRCAKDAETQGDER